MMQKLVEVYGDAALTVAIFAAIGFVIDLAVYRIWVVRARTTKHQASGALARGVHWLPTVFAFLLGMHVASLRLTMTPEVARLLADSMQVVGILAVTLKLSILSGRLVRIYTSREDTALPSSTIFVNLARGTVWIIGLLVVLAALRISITPLITALGVGGLAIGLALQPTLENLFSGIQVLMSRQIEPGDFVRLETGEEGWVQDVTWRNTTIKMLSNDLVIVPNATIGKSRVVNFTSLDEQHSVIVPVGIAYGSDLDEVERVTLDVATRSQHELDGAVRDWQPVVRFYEFGDSSVNLRAVLRVERYDERFAVQSEFIKRLYAAYARAGIEIPFPQRTVHLAQSEPAEE